MKQCDFFVANNLGNDLFPAFIADLIDFYD